MGAKRICKERIWKEQSQMHNPHTWRWMTEDWWTIRWRYTNISRQLHQARICFQTTTDQNVQTRVCPMQWLMTRMQHTLFDTMTQLLRINIRSKFVKMFLRFWYNVVLTDRPNLDYLSWCEIRWGIDKHTIKMITSWARVLSSYLGRWPKLNYMVAAEQYWTLNELTGMRWRCY